MAHNATHEKALSIKKVKPELFPADQTAADFQQGQDGVLPRPETQVPITPPMRPAI